MSSLTQQWMKLIYQSLQLASTTLQDYVEKLGLSSGQQTDVKTQTYLNSTQAGMKVALKYWRNINALEATFKAILLILLSLLKGDIAVQVCKYLKNKCKLLGFHVYYKPYIILGQNQLRGDCEFP